MAQFSRLDTLNTIIDLGMVPIFYNDSAATSHEIVGACVRGGANVIEFTNRGDFAIQTFSALAQDLSKSLPEVILGVGSIVDAPTAALYIAHGANFVVGPILNPEVAELCNRRKIPYMPGCGTLSEISAAEALGVEIVKLFPGQAAGGPGFVKAVLGPCPWTRIMPTGGVDATQESIRAWFEAGVACVGMGSALIRKDWVAGAEFGQITEQVEQVLGWIRDVKS